MLITDNNTINVILWSKESIASNDNIKIKTDMELPASEYINQDDLGTIIDNGLNIGINYLIDDNHEVIYFSARNEDNSYFIRVSNKKEINLLDIEKASLSIINRLDKKLISSILEMKIIQNVLEKYKGEIFYKANNTILIVIPLIKNASDRIKKN